MSFLGEKNVSVILFYRSILIGVLIWLFFFLIIPVKPVNPLSSELIWFVVLNYFSLVFGFIISNRYHTIKNDFKLIKNKTNKFIFLIIFLVLFSSAIRFLDLFLVRHAPFFNSISTNKFNITREENFSVVLGLFAVFRFLYFIPFLFYVIEKKKNKKLLILSLMFFSVPIIEGYLRGARRLIFEPFVLFFIIISLRKLSKLKIKKIILLIVVSIFFLNINSNLILKDRLKEKEESLFLEKIYKAPYNDLMPINQETKQFILDNKYSLKGVLAFNIIHTGQYITHSLYEFDLILKKGTSKNYGMYNGFIFIKLLNKINLTKKPLDSLMNPTGRVTYISFFGGLFLDFGWYSLIVTFLYGTAQNYFFILSDKNYLFKPVVIIFVFTNVFLLTFNFMRAQWFLVIFIYLLLIIFYYLKKKYSIKLL